MKANLIYTPFIFPNVPIGITSIKSFVEHNSDHRIRCIDLNIMWHNKMIKDLEDNRSYLGMNERFKSDFLTGNKFAISRDDTFFSQKEYNEYINNYGIWGSVYNNLDKMLGDTMSQNLISNIVLEWIDLILEGEPDIVGFSVLYTKQFLFSLHAARAIKQHNKNIKIVFGGGHFNRLELHQVEKFIVNTGIDYVITYEGEEAFLKLLNAIEIGNSADSIPNVSIVKDGRIFPPLTIENSNISSFPFLDYSDYDLESYHYPDKAIFVASSRGCYWRKCSFCDLHKAHSKSYQQFSVNRVVDELEYQNKQNGCCYFYFIDEMIAPKRLEAIGKEILNRKLNIFYTVRAKPTSGFTKDTLEIIHKSGCRIIMWGVESGSQKILDAINKGTRVKEISEILRNASNVGIYNHIYMIVGFPTENFITLKDTITFLHKNRNYISKIHSGPYSPIQGTIVYENPEKFGLKNIKEIPGTNSFSYKAIQGIDYEEKDRLHKYLQTNYFNYFSKFSVFFGKLRIHSLMIYSHPEKIKYDDREREEAQKNITKFANKCPIKKSFWQKKPFAPIQ